ncbi:hypothetical protein [Vulcanococcus sp.]|uniref:hypothetical protein n=1 Tax=Vulcanococcus sp. TaxID=2856995 RepID=UPI0037DA3383
MAPDPLQPTPGPGRLRSSGRSVVWLSVAVALVLGLQLGGLPWRYRKQLWQLQGFLLGGAVGYLIGRLDRGERDPLPPP